jgi:hypothetical protein
MPRPATIRVAVVGSIDSPMSNCLRWCDRQEPYIVGIFSVEENEYVRYRGEAIRVAVHKIQNADEVVTLRLFCFHNSQSLKVM